MLGFGWLGHLLEDVLEGSGFYGELAAEGTVEDGHKIDHGADHRAHAD